MNAPKLTSRTPYLLRATYEWLADNDEKPYIVVATKHPGVQLPADQRRADTLTLNIAMSACPDLKMDNFELTFSCRFNGRPAAVVIPIEAVLAIFGKESGQGLTFALPPPTAAAEEVLVRSAGDVTPPVQDDIPAEQASTRPTGTDGKKAQLRVIK